MEGVPGGSPGAANARGGRAGDGVSAVPGHDGVPGWRSPGGGDGAGLGVWNGVGALEVSGYEVATEGDDL